jgi:hypothetical protein
MTVVARGLQPPVPPPTTLKSNLFHIHVVVSAGKQSPYSGIENDDISKKGDLTMYRKMFTGMTCLLLAAAFFVPKARADAWNKGTLVTVDQPIEVPGMVLPAGSYMFTQPVPNDPTLVRIFNADGTHLITTVQGVPDYRMGDTDETALQFEERPTGTPEALKAWFYPGYNSGVQFVYPTQK